MSESVDLDTEEFPILPPNDEKIENLRVEIAADTHAGLVREENEDQYAAVRLSRRLAPLFSTLKPEDLPRAAEMDGYAMAVADGLGGHAAGERASGLAIRNGIRLILASTNWTLRLDDHERARLQRRLRDYFVEIDRSLLEEMEGDPSLKGMATTLTAVYTVGKHGFLVHVGDTRTYRFRAGQIEQLTHDHTVAQGLADAGEIPQEQVKTHPKKHVLTNVIAGRLGSVQPQVATFDVAAGDAILLCSDGLYDLVADEVIAITLATEPTIEAAVEALIQRALEAGGRDNVTVLIARYSKLRLGS